MNNGNFGNYGNRNNVFQPHLYGQPYPYNNYSNITQPYPQQQQQQNYNNNIQYVSRQVNNIEEARNANIDAYNTFLFFDINTNQIYLKRINNNGLTDFIIYSPDFMTGQIQNENKNPLEETNNILRQILQEVKNVQSVSNVSKSSNTGIESNAKKQSYALQQSETNDNGKNNR